MSAARPSLPNALPLSDPAFAARVRPFVQAGLLDLASVHVVDLLALEAPGLSPDVLLGLAFAVQAPRGGHVGVELTKLREQLVGGERAADEADPVAALLFPADAAAWQAAVHGCGLVAPNGAHAPFLVEHGRLLTRRYAGYQGRLAARLLALAGAAPPSIGGEPLDVPRARRLLGALFPPEPGAAAELDLQLVGAASSLLQRLTVISGGPGTGKTFTVKKVLALAHQLWMAGHQRPPRVALVAPTGKAAVRMREAIRAELHKLDAPPETHAWLTGLVPRTIHGLLGFQPGSPTRFRHGAERPLPHELVVVDEASMVDLALMCKLVEAVGPDARLLLLGDRNQLASVEAGSVLADLTRDPRAQHVSPARVKALRALLGPDALDSSLVASDAPPIADAIVHFVKPRRVDPKSGLHALAYETMKLPSGEGAATSARTEAPLANVLAWLGGTASGGWGPFADLAHVEHDGRRLADAALDAIVAGYMPYLGLALCAPPAGTTEETHHATVLTALEQLRVLTPHREGRLGVSGLNRTIEERLGIALRASGHAGVFAGAGRGAHWIGRPILVMENDHELGVMNGDVGVVVERAAGGRAVAFPAAEPGRVLYLSPAQLPPHETVFAMTIHKSQGSEFPHTFLVLPTEPSRLLTRELLYTAMTRAKQRLTVCGSLGVLQQGLLREVRRASGLGEAIWGGRAC